MRKSLVAIAAGAAFVAGGVGLWLSDGGPAPGAVAQAPAGPPPVPVTVGMVTAKDLPLTLSGIGTVQAYNSVIIKSRVDGQIVGVDFTEGQEVEAGALLFQIDPRPYAAALALAQATKAKDEAQLASAQADLGRYSKLLAQGYQTPQSYDQQKALVGQLKASIAGDEAQIDTAKINLGYTEIRAPISGRLGARRIDIGNLVHATDNTALVTIAQVRPIFVSFTLPQQSFDDIRRQQAKAPLVVDAMSSENDQQLAQGKLTLIDNDIDTTTGTIHLKAQFANEDERLWPGEFVNVRVGLGVRPGVPTVPAETVQQGPDGYIVYVVKPGNTVERRDVQVAAIENGFAAVTKGLQPGERVVVSGQYRLTNGSRIAPSAPDQSAAAPEGGQTR
ncbi:MAG TPA: efflux RND transporter periplasmic adaptor subunit [Stellaceae bacterium]|nr:efflux RND transporter periplasmic adaptor subunit [Stellaceae bacterium]